MGPDLTRSSERSFIRVASAFPQPGQGDLRVGNSEAARPARRSGLDHFQRQNEF